MKNKDLLDISKKFGSPVYVYDSNKIKSQYNRLKNAFSGISSLRIHFAVKALSNISVLKFMKKLGTGLDTVSIQEVELGLMAGFDPKKMLTRLCYIDFDGDEFLKAEIGVKIIDDKIIEKYAPNVVEGVKKLSNWAKNL